MIGDVLHLVLAPPDSSLLYEGFFDPLLVSLSIAVAIFASYAALLVAQRASASRQPSARRLWTGIGGVCLGIGIWAMHFVGMLALTLPCLTAYDPALTLLSMAPGILASTLVMANLSRPATSRARLAASGLLLGAGIGTMHFSGMAAMRLDGLIRYDLKLFALSIVVAVGLSTLAVWSKFRLQSLPEPWSRWGLGVSAAVMGTAVSGMHYMAMAAAYFIRDGDASIAEPRFSNVFLAAVVLIVTCAIIVVTLVATALARPALLRFGTLFKVVGILMAGWCGVAWLSADYYGARRERYVDQLASQDARRRVDDVADKVGHEVTALERLARLLSLDESVDRPLHAFGPATARLSSSDEGKRAWTGDPALAKLGRFLAAAATSVDADVVYVVNAAGDCVAASNAGTPESFVGANYADRDYFRQPRSGQPGQQYAMGRVTKVPGLFFSHPVFEDGRFVGAVVVKRDISDFVPWVGQAHAFVTDANGVVILADDPDLKFRVLPGAPISRLPEAERARQYGRIDFQPIDLRPRVGTRLPDLVAIGDGPDPFVMASRGLSDAAITIHVPVPLPELNRVEVERYWLFSLLLIAGNMIIATTTALLMYFWTSKEAKNALERQASELLRANRELERFAEVLAHHLQEPIRQQYLFAQSLEKNLSAAAVSAESERIREDVGFVLSGATRLRSLIKGIQRYLALDLSDPAPQPPCQAGDAFAVARRELRRSLKAVDAVVDVGPLAQAPIAPAHLADVFRELLANAIEYRHPERPLRIRVDAVEHGDDVIIAVRDNGVGIPIAYRDRVFNVFERLHTDGHDGATGIGLAMVKKIVDRAGGRVWIEDGDEGGTCVKLAIRARGAAPACSARAEMKSKRPHPVKAHA